MSSTKPHSKDELDRLVRIALKALVRGQEPSDLVWKQIKLELEKDTSSPPRFRMPWLSLAIQPALTLLLVMLGWVGLGRPLNPVDVRNSSHDPSSPVATVRVEERSASSRAAVIAEEHDLYLLKTQYRLITWSDAKPKDGPPLIVPQDVPPHPWSPEGRLLRAELSASAHPLEKRRLSAVGYLRSEVVLSIEKGGD